MQLIIQRASDGPLPRKKIRIRIDGKLVGYVSVDEPLVVDITNSCTLCAKLDSLTGSASLDLIPDGRSHLLTLALNPRLVYLPSVSLAAMVLVVILSRVNWLGPQASFAIAWSLGLAALPALLSFTWWRNRWIQIVGDVPR
ncbi:MAG: hypothetical protein OEY56_02300 [Cyclobacteriaceae bacterium]|nr:hypothetical protein [Cyclobacteriaceae bacterium]